MKTRKQKILDLFDSRKEVFNTKDSDYGEAWVKSGELFEKIFPNGIALETWRDHCAYQLITRKMDKLLRYINLRFVNTKNQKIKESISDTLGDDAVYSLMLSALEDEEINDKNR